MKFAISLTLICCLLLLHFACKNTEPEEPLLPIPGPPTESTHFCANTNDIYKLWPDSFIVNNKGELYTLQQATVLDVSSDLQFALGTCDGKLALRAEATSSPLAVLVRTEEGVKKSAIAVASGNIYIRNVIAEADIARIIKREASEWVNFEMAMINFNQDTIQNNILAIRFEPEFQKP